MADRDPHGAERSRDTSVVDGTSDGQTTDRESRRAAVEAKYDFEDFGPADMAQMSLEEWEAVFDPDTWITGPELLDRVETELRNRVSAGEVFAVVERHQVDGRPRLLAYTDTEYAVVYPDGTVEGDAGVLADIEPIVALCSMPSFEADDTPDDAGLPHPSSIEPGSGNLGHRLLLALAGVQLIAGVVLLFSPLVVSLGAGSSMLTTVVGLGFLVVAFVLGLLVANARLSDRFRAAAYRERLQAAGVGSDHRPSFLPPMDENGGSPSADENPESP